LAVLDIVIGEADAAHDLVQRRARPAAAPGLGDLEPLQISEALHPAAVDEILAHQQRHVARPRRRRGLVGDDLDDDGVRGGVEDPGGGGAGRHVELAGAERRDHFGAGIDGDEVHLDPPRAEIAALDRDEQRRVGDHAVDADAHGLERLGAGWRGDDRQGERQHQQPDMPRPHVLSRRLLLRLYRRCAGRATV
jgi:hypothetical protein